MSQWTSISYLDIRLADGQTEGVLYGNDAHQAPLIVSFVPTDEDNNPVTITAGELAASVKLVDYVSAAAVSPIKKASSWYYVTEPNEFSARIDLAPAGHPSGLSQVALYLMCAADVKQRKKQIAARIKPTSGAAVGSTMGSGVWDREIKMTAHEPVRYTKKNTVFDERWMGYIGSMVQTNYFLSISFAGNGLEHHVFKADLAVQNGLAIEGGYRMFNLIGGTGWIWKVGAQMSAAISRSIKPVVNQRPAELCLTHLTPAPQQLPTDDQPDANITIYDQFGNTGRFHAKAGTRTDEGLGSTIEIADGFA